ncbi:MAG TPA: hypothetical protein VMT95_01235 [Candidatus Binatia bacterium]|nr:hypothetical protein [Candidatus Binatia bacterium]
MKRIDWHDDPRGEDAALVARVVQAVPELSAAYREHLDDNYQQLLPYMFLPDAVRTLQAQMMEGKLNKDACVRLGRVIEDALAQGGSVRNLALLGLTGEIAEAYLSSRMRGQPSLLEFMRDALGGHAKEAIRQELDTPTSRSILKATEQRTGDAKISS